MHAPHAVLRAAMRSVHAMIEQRGAHPARTVVLLPYAQLMPLARKLWAQERPSGFAPRSPRPGSASSAVIGTSPVMVRTSRAS